MKNYKVFKGSLFKMMILLLIIFSSCSSILVHRYARSKNKYNNVNFLDLEMQDVSGEFSNPKDHAAAVLFINFWGTWCKPCIEEIPSINQISKQLDKKGDAAIVNICVYCKADDWKKLIKEKDLQGINYIADEQQSMELNKRFSIGVEGYPFNVVLDKSRSIVAANILEDDSIITIYALLMAKEGMTGAASYKSFFKLAKTLNDTSPQQQRFNAILEEYGLQESR